MTYDIRDHEKLLLGNDGPLQCLSVQRKDQALFPLILQDLQEYQFLCSSNQIFHYTRCIAPKACNELARPICLCKLYLLYAI